ncbi:response regulator transcription factor [Cohnella silvisoli]|uniref:Response regulator transcription factor n=1 Tax=Cohnella silvisoli TaxID=2873699 RepID=A0ABV1KM30_9BACL|nr:response regulator transcription factor [Cohnella silvisoli]MCD9020792.1 response regulator transcription factor [Cohnella silvisoli]
MIQVLVVDDQTLLREGLQTIINLEEDMRTVGLAANGLEAIEMTASFSPDLVLMDIKMPLLNGIDGMKRIKKDYPDTIVLMLTTFLEDNLIIDAMANGADGFLLKDMAGEQIVQTIREAMKGHLILPAPIAAKLTARLSYWSQTEPGPFYEHALEQNGLYFNEKEREIILLLVQEKPNKQIASTLYMSEGTIRNYISVIYSKIGTNDRNAAIIRLKEFLIP